MGDFFVLVAVDGVRRDAEFGQGVVEQDPGAGPGLTVDEAQALAGQILDAAQFFGIALGHDQPLLADHQVQHHDLGHQPLLFEVG